MSHVSEERRRYFETKDGAKTKAQFLQYLGKLQPDAEHRHIYGNRSQHQIPIPKPDWQLRLEAEQKARALVLFQVKEEAEHLAQLKAAETVVPTMNEVTDWLQHNGLGHFALQFEREGFDDLRFLGELPPTSAELAAVIEAVGAGMKRGHVLKLRQALDRLRVFFLDQTETVVEAVVELIVKSVEAANAETLASATEEGRAATLAALAALQSQAELKAQEAERSDENKLKTEQGLENAKQRASAELARLLERVEEAEAAAAAVAAQRAAAAAVAESAITRAEACEQAAQEAAISRATAERDATAKDAARQQAETDAKSSAARRQQLEQQIAKKNQLATAVETRLSEVTADREAAEPLRLRAEAEADKRESIARQALELSQQLENEVATLREEEQRTSLQTQLDAKAAATLEQQATAIVAQAAVQRRQTLSETLWAAATRGDEVVIKELVCDGVGAVPANIDAVDRLGQTALSKAYLGGHAGAASLLLKLGAEFSYAPIATWDSVTVARWCSREFRWFGRYEKAVLASEVDGLVLLQYSACSSSAGGIARLKQDLGITVVAHAKVLLAKVRDLSARDSGWSAKHAQDTRLREEAAAAKEAAVAQGQATADGRMRLASAERAAATVAPTPEDEQEQRRRLILGKPTRTLHRTTEAASVAARRRAAAVHDEVEPIPEEEEEEDAAVKIELRVRTPEGSWHKLRAHPSWLVSEVKWKLQVRSYFLVFVPTIREIRDFYREM
eukprot:SAG31_NODE_2256_length_6072_cov_9.043529_3_plen_737_part_00